MKKKLLFIDLLSYNKHESLVNNYLNYFQNTGLFEINLISNNIFLSNRNKLISIPDRYFIYNSKYRFLFNQLIILFYITRIKNLKHYTLFFTSYENISFFIYVLFNKINKKSLILINNNFKAGFIHFLVNKYIFKNNYPVLFNIYFIKYFHDDFKFKYFVLDHPIPKLKKIYFKKNHIYCHFTNIPSKIEIQFLENISLKKNLRLLTTSKYLRNNPNFIYSSYFENYFDLISNARYLFISYFYSFRVSGVFYDYLGTNNPIILSTNNFNFSLFNKFSNNLFTMDSSVFEQYHNIDPVCNDSILINQILTIYNEI